MDRPIARLSVSEDGRLYMIGNNGVVVFTCPDLRIIENIGTTHYIRWDAGFEKAMDMASDEELKWLATVTPGRIDRKALDDQLHNRKKWYRIISPCGKIMVYLLNKFPWK